MGTGTIRHTNPCKKLLVRRRCFSQACFFDNPLHMNTSSGILYMLYMLHMLLYEYNPLHMNTSSGML